MPTIKPRSRLARFMMLLALGALERSARADNFTWEQNPISSNWDTAANWAGTLNAIPDDNTDFALVNNTNFVATLTSNRTVGSLTIRSGGDVATGNGTNDFALTVQESLSQNGVTLIEDLGSSLTVRQSPAANDFDTDDLIINSGGLLALRDGARVQVDRLADLNAGGQIAGNGILEINGPSTFANDGVIRANTGGTLVVQSTNGVAVDLDGNGENGMLIGDAESTLIINTATLGPFDGSMLIAQNGAIQLATSFVLADTPGSLINFNGGNGTATLSGVNNILAGTVNVNSGTAVLATPTYVDAAATLTIHEGAAIQFNAASIIADPESIVNEFNTTLIVNNELTIGSGSGHFNWDGLGVAQVVTGHTMVNAGGSLNIDVDSIDEPGIEERYHGTITMNSGSIDVANASGEWEMVGDLEMNNVNNQAPVLSGENVVIHGEVQVGGMGASTIEAPATFRSSSDVEVQAGARLRLGGDFVGSQTVIQGGSWTGAGTVDLNARLSTISAATTVNMPNGIFDIDGDAISDQLVLDAPLTLNVGSMDDNLNNDINDNVDIGTAGRLTMNLTNPLSSYDFAGSLELNGLGGVLTSLHLAGSDVRLLGTTDVSGNSAATSRVEIVGSMNIGAGGSYRFRGGSADDPSWVRAGAIVNGPGDLFVDSVGAGYLRLENGAHVGVEVINRGFLEIGPAAGSATVAGFTQPSAGTYVANIDGLAQDTQYDQLMVQGIADLDGTLEVELNQNGGVYLDPAMPGTFDEFELILASSVVGTFEDFMYGGNLLALSFSGEGQDRFHVGSGLFRILDYDASELDLLNYRALPGDANGDGLVDGSDFGIWNSHKFTFGTNWTTGDFNGDGTTDGSDFGIWNANKFTQVVLGRPGLGGLQAVPEPSGLAACLAGLAVLFTRRKRPRKECRHSRCR